MNRKVVIGEYFPVIAVLLCIVAAFGGFLTFQSFRTDYESVREETFLTSYSGSYEHEAVVVEDSVLWSEGEVLRNRSDYLSRFMPVLDARFDLEFSRALTSGEVSLSSGILLTLTIGGEVYWEDFIVKDEVSESFPRREVGTSFEISPEIVENLKDEIRESIGVEVGSLRARILTKVDISGEIEGEGVDRSEELEMVIEERGPLYNVSTDSVDRRITKTTYVDVPVETPTREKILSILLLVVPLSILGLVAYEWRGIDEEEVKAFRESRKKSEFDDWISRGKVPDLEFREEIKIDSLKDLVDLAVDLEKRVIYDEGKSTYYVFHEDILYTYGESSKILRE